MYNKKYFQQVRLRVSEELEINRIASNHLNVCLQKLPLGLLERYPRLRKEMIQLRPGMVYAYHVDWRQVGTVIKEEKAKIKKKLAKYSKMDLDVANGLDFLERMLEECSCDEVRTFPLEYAFHIGSIGKEYAESRDEHFERRTMYLQRLHKRTFSKEDPSWYMIYPKSCAWRK